MKTNLLKRKEGRPLSSKFLRLFSLLAMLVVGIGASLAQNVISEFSMPTDNPTPAWGGKVDGSVGDDGYALGSNGGVSYFAQGLKDKVTTEGVTTRNFVKKDNGYKLQDDNIETAHFKLQFTAGFVKPGDILTIGANQVYNTTGDIKFKVGGSNAVETGSYTANGPLVEINHTIQANEIITDGDNEYIRLGRCPWPDNSIGFATFKITRLAGITYNANGGTCAKTEDSINEAITLPTATKAGYSFIGWMTASNGITPDAGYPGESKTFNRAATLYALWYKNTCEIDFTAGSDVSQGTGDKAGVVFRENGAMVNGKGMSPVTIGSHDVNKRFVIENGTNWIWRTAGYLYSMNGSARSFGITDCVSGDYIIVNSNLDPHVQSNATFMARNGNTWIYKVTADGGVEFRPDRYVNIYSIQVSSACNHTVWYEEDGKVGPDDLSAGWWTNFSQYYHISKGETLNFKFTNRTNKEKSHNNWVFIAQTNAQHNGDLGFSSTQNERLLVRADGWNWGTNSGPAVGDGSNLSFKRFDNESAYNNGEGTSFDWAEEPKQGGFTEDFGTTFKEDMDNAEVTVEVDFNQWGTLRVKSIARCESGRVYEMIKSSTNFEENDLYFLFTVEKAQLVGMSHPIKFSNTTPSITITANGTAIYDQKAKGNPEGTWIKYTVTGTTGNVEASIAQIDGSNDYQLSVKGKGTVTVTATCGTETATYTLTVDGMMFVEPTPVIAHHKTEYIANLDINDANGVNYTIVAHDTNIAGATLESFSGGKQVRVTIPNNTDGGVVVVRATKDAAIAEFCLTVAHDIDKVWNLYNDPLSYGTVAEGDKTGSRPGSAHYVIFHGDGNYTYPATTKREETDPNTGETVEVEATENVTTANRVLFNQWKDKDDYYAKENWYNGQTGTITQGSITKDYDLLHRNWKYTYKTCTYVNGQRTYVNEPLFAYQRSVIGDNARIVKETAGLIFNANPQSFGVSDNDVTDQEGANAAVREQDRCVLIKAGASMTIPKVKAGRYIKIYSYRHSDNSGDRFYLKNAIDLDGKPIPSDAVLRYTGSTYYGDSNGDGKYMGATIFKVAAEDDAFYSAHPEYIDGDGDKCSDVTYTVAINGWTEIYRVEIMETYVTEQQLCEVKVNPVPEGTKQKDGKTYYYRSDLGEYNKKDLNEPANYNRNETGIVSSRLVSRIQTHAKGASLINAAPEFFISGYAGQCYTWNGWQHTTLTAEPEQGSTAQCQTMIQPVAVGERIGYPMHKVYDIKGSGAVKLTFRTLTGNSGTSEPAYCLNKMEAWVAFGEYSVQDYPYTWDFTKYNMDRENKYENGFVTLNEFDNNNRNENYQYGSWTDKQMQAAEPENRSKYTVPINSRSSVSYDHLGSVDGSYDGRLHIDGTNTKIRNKRFFAQGSQLTIGDNTDKKYTILETEGLRFRLNDGVREEGDGDIKFVAAQSSGSKQRKVWGDANKGWTSTYLDVSNVTITIPEVQKGMYVFIKADKEPAVSGAKKLPADETAEVKSVDYTSGGTCGWKPDKLSLSYDGTDGLTVKNDVIQPNFWDVQYVALNDIPTEAGRSYKVTYTIKGTSAGTIHSKLGDWGGGVTPTFNITTDWQDVEVAYSNALANSFLLLQHGDYVGTVYIKKIVVEEVLGDLIIKEADTFTTTAANVTLLNNELATNTWVYKVTNEGKTDVIVTPQEDTKIEAIGVTNEFKMMTNADGWASESRKLRIDYNETQTFTQHKLKAYIGTSDNINCDEHHDEGILNITNAQVIKGIEQAGRTDNETSGVKRGLILEDEGITVDKNAVLAKRSMIPLFVPACNIPYSDISGNMIHEHYDEGEMAYTDDSDYRYVLTNQYYNWNQTNGYGTKHDPVTTYNYYIVREDGRLRKNSSYLSVNKSNGALMSKGIYLFFDNGDDIVGIDEIKNDAEVIESPEALTIYTLNGVKLNDLPTQRGIYIINGKKVLVK